MATDMLPMLLLALALAIAPAFLLYTLLLSAKGESPVPTGARLSLAAGGGLALSSCGAFVLLETTGLSRSGLLLVDVLPLALLGGLYFRRKRAAGFSPGQGISRAGREEHLALAGVLLAGALACASLASFFINVPYGVGDPITNWTFKARFLYRGGEGWTALFSEALPGWHLVDYPLQLPLSIARLWSYLGQETPAAPISVHTLFWAATLGTLFFTLSASRGRGLAALATVCLLGMPLLTIYASRQYADVPLMFFITATLSLFHLGDHHPREVLAVPALAGLMAGLAAWTKNDGLLLVLVIPAARWLNAKLLRRPFLGELLAFVAGLLLPLLTLAYYKLGHRLGNAMVSTDSFAQMLDKLAAPERYAAIARSLVATLFDAGRWSLSPLLLLGYILIARKAPRHSRTLALFPALTALLLGAGYLWVYLMTPYDLQWHLRTSMDRLVLHLLPAVLLSGFSLLAGPEEAREVAHADALHQGSHPPHYPAREHG